MTWQGWTALGLVGAAIAVPVIRKRMMRRSGSNKVDTFGSMESDSVATMGGYQAPESETWAQSSPS